MNELKIQRIVDALRLVHDPELRLNVYDLGLIYDIIVRGPKAKLLVTLTTPSCPYADQLLAEIKKAALVKGIKTVEMQLTFTPAWSPDALTDEVKLLLQLL